MVKILNYSEKIIKGRNEKDFQFKSHPHSPLTPEDKKKFKKLNYFPVNEELNIKNITINEFENKKHLEIQTNTGQIQHYIDFGKVEFSVKDEKVALHVYKTDKDPNYYFIPFWDMTVKTKETYGAGRYSELIVNNDGTFDLDLNLAYNPYCAYSERFSCPLTPPDNRLLVRIEAGEKNYEI